MFKSFQPLSPRASKVLDIFFGLVGVALLITAYPTIVSINSWLSTTSTFQWLFLHPFLYTAMAATLTAHLAVVWWRRLRPLSPAVNETVKVLYWLVGIAWLVPALPSLAAAGAWIWANPASFISLMATLVSICAWIIWHEIGHWAMAQWRKMRTPVFSLGFGRRNWSLVRFTIGKGELATEVRVSPFAIVGGYVDIPQMEQIQAADLETALAQAKTEKAKADVRFQTDPKHFKKVWERSAVAFAGPANNLIMGFLLFFVVFFLQGKPVIENTYIDRFIPNSIASQVFQPHDVFVSIGGQPIKTPQDVIAGFSSHKNTAVTVIVKRGDQNITMNVTPNSAGAVGLQMGVINGFQKEGLEAVSDAGKTTVLRIGQMYNGIYMMINRSAAPANLPEGALDVHGMWTVAQIGMMAWSQGIFNFLLFSANINIMLAVMNLLPLPVLDGGHLMFFAIEKLRGGKPVDAKLRSWLMRFSMLLLAALIAFSLFNDIFKPFDLTSLK